MARASVQEQKGSTGASEVTGKFTRIGWGFAEITRHDNGIDLFLMARDDRLFDLGLTLGAQVKAGPSYFSEPKFSDRGVVEGWWFRDADGEHLSDLVSHGLPQLLVLYDLDAQVAYWAHVTAEVVESTGKGSKILVPATNTVDEAHRAELLEIASATRPQPMWEGSAWGGAPSLAERDVLRHALIAPRLVAPHPNSDQEGGITATQAIAMLMQTRLNELAHLARSHDSVPSIDEAKTSTDWTWRFFGALGHRLRTGEVDDLQTSVAGAPSTAARIAGTISAVAGLLEEDRPDEAITILAAELELDDAAPIDHAWLTVQHARALAEVGKYQEARDAAASVQGLRRLHPEDVTAAAIEGIAAQLLFRITEFGSGDISSAIRGADTAVAWWRQQARGQGLGAVLERSLREWAVDKTIRWAASDVANDRLLAAALTATLAGDHGDWRYTTGLLGRDQLIRLNASSDPSSARAGLATLRLAGAREPLKQGTLRLVSNGPALGVREAASAIQLETSTATTARSNLDLLRYGGPVLEEGTADSTANWLLATLGDPSEFIKRTRPSYELTSVFLDTLAGVLGSASEAVHVAVITNFLTQAPIEDQLHANSWARVVGKIRAEVWTSEQARQAAERVRSDHWELLYPVLGVVIVHQPAIREELITDIRNGNLNALAAFGDVRDLDAEVASTAIGQASNIARRTISNAQSGAFEFGGLDAGDILALLNLWHPEEADWESLIALLADRRVSHDDKYSAFRRLAQLTDRIPENHRERLLAAARDTVAQRPGLFANFGSGHDAAGPAALLQAALTPDADAYAALILALGSEDWQRRVWVARIAGDRASTEDVGLLAALVSDREPDVRAAAAYALCRVVNSGQGSALAEATLNRAAEDPGLTVPLTIANALSDADPLTPAASKLLEKLAHHPFRPVSHGATRVATRMS